MACNYTISIEMEITADFNGALRAMDRSVRQILFKFPICTDSVFVGDEKLPAVIDLKREKLIGSVTFKVIEEGIATN